MKKLTVLVVIMLVAGLLAGCWLFSDEPELISITVLPESMDLSAPNTTSAVFTNPYSDTIKSVTANYDNWTSNKIAITDCELNSNDTGIATVNEKGLVTAVGKGETYILVSYTEGKFPFKITQEDIVGVTVN